MSLTTMFREKKGEATTWKVKVFRQASSAFKHDCQFVGEIKSERKSLFYYQSSSAHRKQLKNLERVVIVLLGKIIASKGCK